MRREYLDQNKWIDLARAASGRSDGEPFIDALAVCRFGVENGLAHSRCRPCITWRPSSARTQARGAALPR